MATSNQPTCEMVEVPGTRGEVTAGFIPATFRCKHCGERTQGAVGSQVGGGFCPVRGARWAKRNYWRWWRAVKIWARLRRWFQSPLPDDWSTTTEADALAFAIFKREPAKFHRVKRVQQFFESLSAWWAEGRQIRPLARRRKCAIACAHCAHRGAAIQGVRLPWVTRRGWPIVFGRRWIRLVSLCRSCGCWMPLKRLFATEHCPGLMWPGQKHALGRGLKLNRRGLLEGGTEGGSCRGRPAQKALPSQQRPPAVQASQACEREDGQCSRGKRDGSCAVENQEAAA